jgi:hypothetical protein
MRPRHLHLVEPETTLTFEGLRNGLLIGLLCWTVILGGIYAAWQALTQ